MRKRLCIGLLAADAAWLHTIKRAGLRNAGLLIAGDAHSLLNMAEQRRIDVAAIELRTDALRETLDLLAAMHIAFEQLPLVVLTRGGRGMSTRVSAAFRSGATELIVLGDSDARDILTRAIASAAQTSALTAVQGRLLRSTPEQLRPFLDYALKHLARSLSVEALARSFGITRRALLARFSAVHWPPPSWVITWCRLLVAARLLEDPRRTVDQVASAVGLFHVFRESLGMYHPRM